MSSAINAHSTTATRKIRERLYAIFIQARRGDRHRLASDQPGLAPWRSRCEPEAAGTAETPFSSPRSVVA
jgi:hypothetical protein